MNLIDTHCHIHEIVEQITPVYEKWHGEGELDADTVITEAKDEGVTKLVCVGTSLADSELAANFVADREGLWTSIGIHPHEAKLHLQKDTQDAFAALAARDKVIAVGECGLDYFYAHSPKEDQIALLHFQIKLALANNLPMIFHVRDASPAERRHSVWSDFWPIFEQYSGIRGVLHSYTDSLENMQKAIEHGLYIGVNGIATFAKEDQLAVYKAIPLEHLLLETDAPFLTPRPHRGTINKPKYVALTAEFLSNLRQESLEKLAKTTTANVQKLFGI